jgi:hypothetical protein
MKQQILNLKKKLLIVEIGGELGDAFVELIRKHGMAEIVGKLNDIKEGEFEQWVADNGLGCYDNYKGIVDNKYTCLTAKESFFSYLESKGIYFENPLGEKPILNEDNLWGNAEQDTQVFAALNYQIDKWQEAEQKVWNKNLIYIFQII